MTKGLEVFLKQSVRLLDGIVITVAFLATYYLRQNVHVFYQLNLVSSQLVLTDLIAFENYLWLLLIILPVWIFTLRMLGAYTQLRSKTVRATLGLLLVANLLGFIALNAFIFILKFEYVSRSFIVMFFVMNLLALSFERILLIRSWRKLARNDFFKKNVLLVGTGARAASIIKSIQAHSEWGLNIIGIMDDDASLVGQRVEGVDVVGVLSDLRGFLKNHVVDEVFFVVPRGWMEKIETSILECEHVGVKATVAVDMFNTRFAKISPSDLQGTPLITFDATPHDHWQLAIKKVGDVATAAFWLIVLSPLLITAALLVKLTSKGPIFFKQVRCGLNGRRFTMYKFRTMVVDAEKKLSELRHLNEMGGPVFKMENDPRLTPVGRWLRKTSIDELPQLFNVMRGDMSLIGPRPPVPDEVAQYKAWQRRRLSMRPGITGNWQVSGRNRVTDFNTWMRLDLDYIDKWSLMLDLKILLKTVPAVLSGSGAK